MVKYFPRKLEAEVEKWIDREKSVVIVGPRRAGKTTLLKHLSEKHNWPYYTLDDPETLQAIENLKNFAKIVSGSIFLLDEGQYDPEIGRKLKYLHNVADKRFVASGSGSFDVRVRVTGELVGRAARIELLPLNFAEFVSWKADKSVSRLYLECRAAVYGLLSSKEVEPPVTDIPFLHSLWQEYTAFGGYPEVVLAEGYPTKEELLNQIIATYIDRDIVGFLGVKEHQKFRKTVEYLARTVSTPLKKNSLMESAGATYRTVEHYLALLTATFLVFPVSPLPIAASALRKAEKYYFYDLGVRNTLAGSLRVTVTHQNIGPLLENFVARHLKQEFGQIYYYRKKSGAEVDFVLMINDEPTPIEVKAGGKPSRGFYSFLRAHKPERAFVVTLGEFRVEEKGGTRIYYVPAWFL